MLSEDEILEIGARAISPYWEEVPAFYHEAQRKAIRAALAALSEAGLVLEQGWRFDMENAPRDGTRVLLYLPDGANGPQTIVQAQWSSSAKGYWAEAFSDMFIYPDDPTAWRHLYAPPTEAAA